MNFGNLSGTICRRTILTVSIAGAIGLFSTSTLSAQDVTPESVLQRFVDVTGGVKEYKALKTMTTKGKVSIPMMQMEGEMEIIQDFENGMMITDMQMPGLGTEKAGTDGETVWKFSTTQGGAQVLEDREAVQVNDQASMSRVWDFKNYYTKMKLVGKKKINDEECYQLDLTNKHKMKSTEFYSVETGLQVKSISTVVTPQGEIKIENFSKNYKEVGGVKIPHSSEQKMGPMTIVTELTEVKANEKLKDNPFELPSEVSEMVEQIKAKKAKEKAAKEKAAKEKAAKEAGSDKKDK